MFDCAPASSRHRYLFDCFGLSSFGVLRRLVFGLTRVALLVISPESFPPFGEGLGSSRNVRVWLGYAHASPGRILHQLSPVEDDVRLRAENRGITGTRSCVGSGRTPTVLRSARGRRRRASRRAERRAPRPGRQLPRTLW